MTRHGRVTSFDGAVGLGVVRGDDGIDYRFHCVEIADGSRSIAVHTAVRFTVTSRLGGYEASAIHPA